jgi:hypothetical protein
MGPPTPYDTRPKQRLKAHDTPKQEDETASPDSNSQQRERQQTDLKITGTTKTHSKNN